MEPCYREVVKKAARGKDEKVSLGVVDTSPAGTSTVAYTLARSTMICRTGTHGINGRQDSLHYWKEPVEKGPFSRLACHNATTRFFRRTCSDME